MVSNIESDRGQLLLVGAVTIAFIILGLVVVVNGVLYTQVIDSGNTIESANDAKNAEFEVTRGVRGLIQEVNRNHDESDLEGDVNANLSAFDRAYRNATADSRPTIVDVSRNSSPSIEYGTMIYSDEISGGNNTNNVYQNAAASPTIGQFVVTLDTDQDGSFDANFTNGPDVEFDLDDSEDELDVTGDSGITCTVAMSGGTVTVDVLAGMVDGTRHDCLTKHVSADVRGNHDGLSFDQVDDIDGGFEVVVDENSVLSNVASGYETKTIAWSVPVTVSYDSNEIGYERDRVIEIYGENYD